MQIKISEIERSIERRVRSFLIAVTCVASPAQRQRTFLSLSLHTLKHTHTPLSLFSTTRISAPRLLDTSKPISVVGFRLHIFDVITPACSDIEAEGIWEIWKMLEDQVAYLLQRYLGNYVRGLNKEALKISVWQGHNYSHSNSSNCCFWFVLPCLLPRHLGRGHLFLCFRCFLIWMLNLAPVRIRDRVFRLLKCFSIHVGMAIISISLMSVNSM